MIELQTKSATVSGAGNYQVDVVLDLTLADIVAQLGADELLDIIGEKAAIKYFNIEVVE